MALWREASDYLGKNPIIFLYALLAYIAIYLYSVFTSKPKPDKNPFETDDRKPRRPYVFDQAERDKVIKQGFAQKRIPDNIDAIVIGSGIGGLCTAAVLSRAGKKVLVLEQHDQAGGCCHSFIEKGYEFDVGIHYVGIGIHYIGEMAKPSVSRTVLQQISEGQINWASLGDSFDQVAMGAGSDPKCKRIDLYSGDKYKAELLKHFPEEKEAINQFIKDLKECHGLFMYTIMLKALPIWLCKLISKLRILSIFTSYTKFTSITTEDYINKLTDNVELKCVIGYCFGDYGVAPDKSSFLMQALLLNHFTTNVASYPEGGASEIAFNIIPVIERSGGKVLVRANVTEILCENGRAVGVRVTKGNENIDIRCKKIISAAGVHNTLEILPIEMAKKTLFHELVNTQRIQHGVGALSLFIGLKGDSEELNLPRQNTWAFTDPNLSKAFNEYYEHTPDPNNPKKVPLLFIGFPSAKDPLHAERHPGKSTCAVITLAHWDWFKQWQFERVKKRGDDYEALKDSLKQQMWKQTLEYFPHLEDKVDYFELGTTLSNKYYLGGNRGEIYGLDHNMERFQPQTAYKLRAASGIPGLYMSGQDIATCGFTGALYSGLLTSSEVLHRNTFNDLIALHKQIKKHDLAAKNKKD